MSGVTVGTRLEQLEQLRRRLDLEIAAEKRRVALGDEPPEAAPRRPVIDVSLSTPQLLERHGLVAKTVKRWAVSNGLIPAVVRGRVPRHLVLSYLEARL